jgi:hypothetical protein
LKTAQAALTQKQDAAANAQDDSQQTEVAQAKAAVETALANLQTAKTAADQALKQQQQAEANVKAAQEAKTAADKEAETAREFQQQAQQEKQRADQLVRQRQSESNPRNIHFNVPSNSLTIQIAEFPIKLESLPEQLTVKQGEMIEVPIKLSHLYDFKANVNVQTRLPGGVGGVSVQTINVPADKPEGKFQVSAQAGATVGVHACTVRLQMNFNGQNLTMERPLTLTVVEVTPEK